MEKAIEQVAAQLSKASQVLVVTGAGISAESGVPTFRGADGLWNNKQLQELATPEGFARQPAAVWEWYRARRKQIMSTSPNPGHMALVELERRLPRFLLVTQNVDGLHLAAGSRSVSEIHGSLHHSRCTRCSDVAALPEADVDARGVPSCARCGGALRPHIVWFGEAYAPGVLEAAFQFAMDCQVVMTIGTSGQVMTAGAIAFRGHQFGAYAVDINPEVTELSLLAHTHLKAPAGQALPAIMAQLRTLSVQ